MSKKGEKITAMVAFWRYDHYPYVLGAEVTEMDDQGRVYAPSYQGWVTPIKLLPKKAGKDLLESLKSLKQQYEAAYKDLQDVWAATLLILMPEAKSPHISVFERLDKKKKTSE